MHVEVREPKRSVALDLRGQDVTVTVGGGNDRFVVQVRDAEGHDVLELDGLTNQQVENLVGALVGAALRNLGMASRLADLRYQTLLEKVPGVPVSPAA